MQAQQLEAKDHIVFVFVTFMYWASQYLYTPILSPYLEYKGASYMLIGVVLSSYGVTQLLLRLPIGVLSDYRQVRRPFIWLGMVTSLFSCLGFAVTDHVGWALFSRAVAGISASAWVVFTVLYSSYFTGANVTKAMSTIHFITVSAQLMGMGVSGYLVSRWGWNAPFWIGAGVAFLGLALSFLIREPKPEASRKPIEPKDLANVMKEPILLKVSILSIIAHGMLFITMYGFTPLQALKIGADKESLGWLVVAFMLPHAVASIVAGRYFAVRFGHWPTLAIGFAGSAAFTVVIPYADTMLTLCLTQIGNGFTQGMGFPLFLGMAIQYIESEKRATAMGFYQAIYSLGIFLGPFLAGWLNSGGGLANGFIFASLSGLLAAGLSIYWSKAEKRSLTTGVSLDRK
ncbi:MFS transporter [Brevibacillus agri]|uniref:MFS transporter n=1 Tax=Brevibacillus agri TaxID=51101 RepID=UPI0028705917|nr:MFS transporter [Brevibacillus agri]MDR9507118.1 MFS transporter [Brevibacillus agri]